MTDQQWSQKVKEKFGNRCHWAPCYSRALPIEAAHIVGRWNPSKRHDVDNGIPLCSLHHRIFDSLSRKKKRDVLKILGRNVIQGEFDFGSE